MKSMEEERDHESGGKRFKSEVGGVCCLKFTREPRTNKSRAEPMNGALRAHPELLKIEA
jgi:hypothetical protein